MYQTHLQSVGKTTTFAAKAMSGLKQVGAMALNIGSGFAAGIAFDFLLKGIDYVVNYSDNLIKKGEEARSSISETFDEFSKGKSTIEQLGTSFASSGKEIKTTEDAISSIANKYTELSSGVDKFSNANKSLSTSEYEDYLNICNQVAEQFPTLVSGYDAQGNAILNMGNSASSAAKSMLDLYDAQMLSANVEIGDKLDDAYAGTVHELRGYIFDSEALEDEIKRIDDDIKNSQSLADANGYEFTVDDDIIAKKNEKLKEQASYNLRIKDSLDQLTNSAKSYLQTSKSFTDINDDIENAFLGNMSLAQKDLKDVADNYDGDIRSFLYDNIIQPLSDLEPESQEKLSKLLTLDPSDMSLSEYKSTISNTIKDIFPDDKDLQNQMKRNLGFKDIAKDAENQLKRLTSKFGDAAKSLSLDELQKGYDLIVNDGFTGTFDQFKSKIEEAKQLAATEVDLKANTNFDAITTADETENAGDDYLKGYQYLQEAKEMFDKGLIGTDDFKTRAAYFSPTGADDPVNFAENYAKAARYLTEDSSGVINFLNDLSTKTNESGEALASFDAATGRWKYNIDDLQQASRDMGIGFEFMMDMFGRLEDYGFSNNFVGSIEDGTARIADKAKELAEAKAELARLESKGDYTTYDENGNVQKTLGDQTAIDQMRAKVQGLEDDIQQTKDAMSQLIAKSAADYDKEITAAKDTISSLKEERKKILDDPSVYGENTDIIAKNLEDQIRDIAGEYGIELDANLNIIPPSEKPTLEADLILSQKNLDSELSNLAPNQKLVFDAELDGNVSEITALMGEDGKTVTFTANVNDVETKLAMYKDPTTGTITFTADTSEVDKVTGDDYGGEKVTTYIPETSQIDKENENTDGGERVATYVADLSFLPNTLTPVYRKVIYEKVSSGIEAGINAVKGAVATGTMLSPARASGTAYNMLNLKPAYADGRIALSKDEEALVNEIGTESLIRSGVWSLIPGGMHVESLKKGDIVLSASQTKMLLETGRAIGHGKAYAGGSGGGYNPVLNGGSYWAGGSNSYTPPSQPAPKPSTKSSSSSSSEKEFNEKIDEIEILLDRMESSLQRLTDSIETYSYDLSKQSEVSTQAMNQIRTNLGTLQQAYNRYIQEANSVGLDEGWKQKVQSGAINIETITDETLKENIDEYQKWFDKATDVQDKIAEMQQELLDLAVEKLDNIEQYFENRTDYNDNFGYLTPLTLLQESIDKFTKELEKQVGDGVIKEGSNEHFEAMEKLADMQEKLFEATIKKYQDIIDNLSRISDTLDNSLELKDARDEPILESDYKKQIDLNNQAIQEKYNKRQQLIKQQAIYDVGSVKYDELAEDIASIDDDIYGLLTDIEELKDKIWEVRWEPFFEGQEALKDLVDETDTFRDLLDSDAFVGKNGGLTADGLANLALLSSAMNEQKQSIKNYSAALEKLQEDYDKGNISAKEFKETSKEFLDEIASGVANVENYKDEIISLYTEMLEKENDVVQSSIQKHKELLDIKKKNSDYDRNVKKQVKDINTIQAQISALQGVNNESAKAELKRLNAELENRKNELFETQKDREYDVRQSGFDNLSDDLNSALEDTLDEVKYNASKQEEVISEMLNHVVNNYKDAYGKINQIIGNTGFKPSDDFQQNIDNLGSQSGASNQVQDSNTIAPNYKPDDFVGNTNTGQIQSDSSQSNNDKIESEIEKEPNITNRPVAQLTLKPSSVTIEEGKSQNVTANIRPTDAANKTLTWKSSNTGIATVSNGSVKAIKPGSCQVTASTNDGSGISATVGVTVTAKPKPKPPAPKPSGGDGVPWVGDKVTFTGSYYYDSWGQSPAGNLYSGVPGGVVIDGYSGTEFGGASSFHGGYGVHIRSADGRYGDLGWVSLSQISGYAKGTKGIKKDLEFAKINEQGNELVIRRGGNDYTTLTYGSAVVPHNLSENLFTLAKHTDQILNTSAIANRGNGTMEINNHYDSLLTVNGNVDKDALPGLKQILQQSYEYTSKKMYKDANLMGIQKKL